MSDDGFQNYLFEYRFDGVTWGFAIMARSPEDAKARVKQLVWAKYQGEVKATIYVPAGFIWRWFRRIRAFVGSVA